MKNIWLKVQGVSKVYPGTKALNKVDLEVKEGEIHAIVGENGAGKTTLMRILAGEIGKDEGSISINGKKVDIVNPRQAQNLGISLVHQELSLFPNLNVAENIFQNRQKTNTLGFISFKELIANTQKILHELDTTIKPQTLVRKLSVSQKQLIEIAHALSLDVKLLILDEPTSALSEHEAAILFNVLRELKNKGVSILYITHKLKEVFQIADRITVLRDGKLIATDIIENFSKEKLIIMMVGREVQDIYPAKNKSIGEIIFEVRNYTGNRFKNISFNLRKGEILGIFGLVGAGRTEAARSIFGLDKKYSGDIFLTGNRLIINSPNEAIKKGIGYLPEDRKETGLFLKMNIRENVIAAAMKSFSGIFFMNRKKEKIEISELVKLTEIKTTGSEQKVFNLSGGNQQKVLLSKWLTTKPKVLIVDEPTRGIDVGARAKIHSLLCKLADESGMGIVLISSDLLEVMGLSDRILVMFEGEVMAELGNNNLTEDIIMTYASGHCFTDKSIRS